MVSAHQRAFAVRYGHQEFGVKPATSHAEAAQVRTVQLLATRCDPWHLEHVISCHMRLSCVRDTSLRPYRIGRYGRKTVLKSPLIYRVFGSTMLLLKLTSELHFKKGCLRPDPRTRNCLRAQGSLWNERSHRRRHARRRRPCLADGNRASACCRSRLRRLCV